MSQRPYRRILLTLCLVWVLATPAWAATTQWAEQGTTTDLLLPNSLASNAYTAVSATYNNTVGQTGNGYLYCRFEAILAFPASPSAGAAVYIWVLESLDGSNFATTPTATITTGAPTLAIPITTGTGVTGTRNTVTIRCPPGSFRIVAQLNGTGQTTNGTGNTIRLRQFTPTVQ
jgi:hypothetical protein